ncbi:MAPEG family protein [Thaumasiovibrio subtropicus]|uniref:MAPEG family protein n=1 Tax=Thaumasiovibrio subtropicus TaxID=1891207 RepID=UPI000B357B61|nr:MAPEG family protein [Thaumasiovibrio subtropicus]
MVSFFYVALVGWLICFLAIQVIKARRKAQVKYADGGDARLQQARSAHANCIEYSPIALMLLFGLEYNGGPLWLVHVFGLLFVIGRCYHASGILSDRLQGRVIGMHATLWPIIAMGILNMWLLPWTQML